MPDFPLGPDLPDLPVEVQGVGLGAVGAGGVGEGGLTGCGGSVGKGVLGVGRSGKGVGAKVLSVPASANDTTAAAVVMNVVTVVIPFIF